MFFKDARVIPTECQNISSQNRKIKVYEIKKVSLFVKLIFSALLFSLINSIIHIKKKGHPKAMPQH